MAYISLQFFLTIGIKWIEDLYKVSRCDFFTGESSFCHVARCSPSSWIIFSEAGRGSCVYYYLTSRMRIRCSLCKSPTGVSWVCFKPTKLMNKDFVKYSRPTTCFPPSNSEFIPKIITSCTRWKIRLNLTHKVMIALRIIQTLPTDEKWVEIRIPKCKFFLFSFIM